MPKTDRTLRATATERARDPAATDATRKAATVLSIPTRRVSMDQTEPPRLAPNVGSPSGRPAASAKVKTTPTAPATAHTKAATVATRKAAARRGSSGAALSARVRPG